MQFMNYSMETITPCPDHLCVVPYRPYVAPKKQFGLKPKLYAAFEVNKIAGVLLKPPATDTPQQLDNGYTPLMKSCGTKITYVIQFPGYQSFKPQKYAHHRRHGDKIPNKRIEVVKQIAHVMEAFLQRIENERYNPLFSSATVCGGIALDHLYLLELRQVANASFQPIFAVKRELAFWNYVGSPISTLSVVSQFGNEREKPTVNLHIRKRAAGIGSEYVELHSLAEAGLHTNNSEGI